MAVVEPVAARAAVLGAGLNVRINAASLSDKSKAQPLLDEAEALVSRAKAEEAEILTIVDSKI